VRETIKLIFDCSSKEGQRRKAKSVGRGALYNVTIPWFRGNGAIGATKKVFYNITARIRVFK